MVLDPAVPIQHVKNSISSVKTRIPGGEFTVHLIVRYVELINHGLVDGRAREANGATSAKGGNVEAVFLEQQMSSHRAVLIGGTDCAKLHEFLVFLGHSFWLW